MKKFTQKTNEEKHKQVESLVQQIDSGVQGYLQSDRYKELLFELSKFRQYSFNNRFLILCQNPSATRVNSFKRWNELGRKIKPNEKSLKILAPKMGKITEKVLVNAEPDNSTEEPKYEYREKNVLKGYTAVPVFDISQTEGEDLTIEKVCADLTGQVDKLDAYFDCARKVVPIPIKIEEYKTDNHATKGYCSKNEIVVYRNPALQMLKTLIHEMAHVLLGHTADGNDMPRSDKECQAESVAYIVSSVLGFDVSDYSFEYVAGWSDGGDIGAVKKSLTEIVKVSELILDGLEKVSLV